MAEGASFAPLSTVSTQAFPFSIGRLKCHASISRERLASRRRGKFKRNCCQKSSKRSSNSEQKLASVPLHRVFQNLPSIRSRRNRAAESGSLSHLAPLNSFVANTDALNPR